MMSTSQQTMSVSLKVLLKGILDISTDLQVSALALDAREVHPGGLFFAVCGSQFHGLKFAEQAVTRGASVIVYDPDAGGQLLAEELRQIHVIPFLSVSNLTDFISEISARFYQHPSRQLTTIGITGTNGKTSVSHLIAQALASESDTGVIGTLGWGHLDGLEQTINTTPDAVSLQAQLASLVEQKVDVVAMEVSSHGLEQGRVSAVQFESAVFTNLSHEHLDYHGSMAAYGEAKLALFRCPSLKFVVVNMDDAFSEEVLRAVSPQVRVVGFGRSASRVKGVDIFLAISNDQQTANGLSFDLESEHAQESIKSTLIGRFNIDNLVTTLATLLGMGWSLNKAAATVALLKGVPGRMQRIDLLRDVPMVVVDYAHTPDALESTLSSLREQCSGLLTVVFGCGGNRDQQKRPLMGDIAGRLADVVIVTNDNPRDEDAEQIAQHVSNGVKDASKLRIVLDRQEAITRAIESASTDDVVLIAGKGHENEQQVGAKTVYFNDAECVQRVFQKQRGLG